MSISVIKCEQRGSRTRILPSQIERSKAYSDSLETNLFKPPMMICAQQEYRNASGHELVPRRNGKCKMQSLYSSSALCFNVFHYWRLEGQIDVVLQACGLSGADVNCLRFEEKLRIPRVTGTPPNADVFVAYDDGAVAGCEGKFQEPFSNHKEKLSGQYFDYIERAGLRKTLPGLCAVADDVRQAPRNRGFDRSQLICTALGLHAAAAGHPFKLVYLWYDAGGSFGQAHRSDAEAFASSVTGGRFECRTTTWQDVFRRLRTARGEEHSEYIKYLRERYFPEV